MSGSIAILPAGAPARFVAAGKRPAPAVREVLGRHVEYQILTASLTLWTARRPGGPANPVATTLACLLTGMMRPLTGTTVCTGAWDGRLLAGLDAGAELDLRRWLDAICAHPQELRAAESATRVAGAWSAPSLDRTAHHLPLIRFPR